MIRPKNLKNASELLQDAQARDYGLGGIETWDQTSLKAALEVAAETNSPMQILVGGPEVKTIGITVFTKMAFQYIAEASVPICLHLDECPDVDTIMNCLEAGFSSVHFDGMFEGAELDFNTNVRITKQVVKAAAACNASVEASLGAMPFSKQGTASELIGDDELGKGLTDVDEAVEFVAQTGINVLAPSVGNIHALYKEYMPEPNLELARRIHKATGLPLSLHGSTGATDKQVRQLISCGFRKVNIGTRLMEIYRQTMRSAVNKYQGYPCAFKILDECRLAMKREVTRLVTEVYGSSDKAR